MKTYQEIKSYLEQITGATVQSVNTQYAPEPAPADTKANAPIIEFNTYYGGLLLTAPSLSFQRIYVNPNDSSAYHQKYEFLLRANLLPFDGGYKSNDGSAIIQNGYAQRLGCISFHRNTDHDNLKLHLAQEITLATVFDNEPKLRQLLTQHLAEVPNMSIAELVAKLGLFVLAAGNGAIKVVKHLIALGITTDQRATVPEEGSVKKLELSPLAAAVHAIPNLGHEKSRELIILLLEAGADYNYQVRTRWTEQRGYAGSVTVERESKTRLFDLDKSGLFSELVEARRKKSHSKDKGPAYKPFAQATSSAADTQDVSGDELSARNRYLESEVARLSQAVSALQKAMSQVEAHLGIQLEVGHVETSRGGHRGGADHRGRGSRSGRGSSAGFYDNARGQTKTSTGEPSTTPQL